MTLENTYEDCLLETCVLIFECLDKISQYRDDDLNTVQDVKDWAKKIAAADQKCRGFIAIFEEVPIIKEGTERQFENLEDETDSDDSSRQTEKLDNEEITQGTSAPGAKESKV